MSPIASVEYLHVLSALGDFRFAVREGAFTPSHLLANLEQFKADRAESPFLGANVTGFGGGVKPQQMDDAADWVQEMVGLEPAGPTAAAPYPWLEVAMALEQAYSAAGAGELVPLAADRGVLYAGEQGSASVLHSTDGVTWTAVATGSGGTNVTALAAMNGVVIAGFDNKYVYMSLDQGATWSQAMDITSVTMADGTAAAGATAKGVSVILPDAVFTDEFQSAQYAYYVGEQYEGKGLSSPSRNAILCWQENMTPSGVRSGLCLFNEPYCKAGIIHDSAIWLCTAELAEPVHGVLYSRPLQSPETWAGGGGAPFRRPTRIAAIAGNYATSAASYGGKTYWGCALRGELYACDGSTVELVRTFKTTHPLRGLAVHRDCLWVSVHNDTDGRLEVWRYDGTAWSLPHAASVTLTAAGQLVAFADRLRVAGGNGTGRRIFAVSASNRNTSASVTFADAVYGAPALAKRYRQQRLQHAALASGQSVEALYALDGGSRVSLGTNAGFFATRTLFGLPESAVGGRLAATFAITNGAAQDLVLYGGRVDALPAPDARQVWDAELLLAPQAGGTWPSDGAADAYDALQKLLQLFALHDRSEPFQAVAPFVDGAGVPRLAMRAVLDLQTDLRADFSRVQVEGAQATTRVRLIEAAPAENLLQNASFELDTVGSHPSGWTLAGTATTWQTEAPGFAGHGNRVLGVTFDGLAATVGIGQTVGVVPGRWHTLSGALRRAGFAGGGIALYLRVTEGGTPIAGAETTHLAAGSDAGLIYYTKTFLVPASSSGTVRCEVYASGTPNGSVYADSLWLAEGAPARLFGERGS